GAAVGLVTLRTRQSLSICWPVRGRCSDTWMPETFVSLAANLPRISRGASGLGSQVSRWLGPPASQIRIAESAVPVVCPPSFDVLVASASAKYFESDNPMKLSTPTRSTSRRWYFSQSQSQL